MGQLRRSKPLKPGGPLRRKKRLKPLGRRGKQKREDKAAAKGLYLARYGYTRGGLDVYEAPCQSCRELIRPQSAEMAHKKKAGSGGDKGGRVQPENLIFCCMACHDAHEEDAAMRAELMASEANAAAGGFVQWSSQSLEKIKKAKQQSGWIKNR